MFYNRFKYFIMSAIEEHAQLKNTHGLAAHQLHHLQNNQINPTHVKMTNRHLLSVSQHHNYQLQNLHTQSSDYILGMSPGAFIMLNIFIAIVITISLIIWVCYRRYRARLDYNQNPQLFPHVPDLSSKQEKHLNRTDLKVLFGKPTIKKDQSNLQGPIFNLTFEGQKSGAYFDLIQNKECYFQIEVIQLSGSVNIGYLQKESLQNVIEEAETLGSIGVSLSTSGFVIGLGQNIYNYGWTLQYGDVIGIALTKECDKFNERRAWVTKNGILQNSPPSNELGKWLATVQITAQQRQEYNMGSQNPAAEKSEGKQMNQEQLQLKAAADKAAREREQNLLQQQRISLKTYKNFQFYPAVVFSGLKTEGKGKKTQKAKTVINLNVGGQIFRMQQGFFRSGLLKPQ